MGVLNNKQLEACHHIDGPLLILAGAGSGKTRVITHRIAYLIQERGVDPYNILAITFTNKAANEMKERVENLVQGEGLGVWVSTFHSMCVRVLRVYGERIGIANGFTIYDTDEQKVVIRDILKRLNLDPKLYPEKAMISAISKAKEQYITPDEYEKSNAASYRDQQIASVYREYEERLKSNNALDFDDLICKTIFLFETNPDVLEIYQTRFKYIMVDEYQDTNHVQFILIKQLAGKYKNLCVVGDDDQSIYKFRGANIYNILNFENEYENTKVIKLEQNYRSTSNILNAANAVVACNQGRKDKTLWTDKGDGDKIEFNIFPNEYDEGHAVVREVMKLSKQGISLDEIAILYRTNNQSRIFEEALIRDNVPYKIYGGTNFYSRKEVRDVIGYIKVMANPDDDNSLKRIINVPKRGIGDTTVSKVETFAIDNGLNLYDAILDIEEIPGISRAVDKIKEFANMMEGLRDMVEDGEFLINVFDALMEKTEYIKSLEAEGTDEAKARIENVLELRGKISHYENNSEEPSLVGLLEDVALVADVDNGEDDDNAKLTLMTLHSAKGLEFPYVFMVGMEDGLFPSNMSINTGDEDDIEEERRLCYVGITRAMMKLYMSAAKMRTVHGATNYSDVSRFIKEIPEQYISVKGSFPDVSYRNEPDNSGIFGIGKGLRNIYSSENYIDSAWKKKPVVAKKPVSSANPGFGKAFPMNVGQSSLSEEYMAGDIVRHLKFGRGTVISVTPVSGDKEIVVDFDRVGEKKMFVSLVKMKKLEN